MTRAATPEDIRRIYRATIDDLYGIVSSRCAGDRDLAEDVTQEAWLRAVRAWEARGLPDEPLAWLTTVSRNILANHFGRQRAEPLDESVLETLASEGGDDGCAVPDNNFVTRSSPIQTLKEIAMTEDTIHTPTAEFRARLERDIDYTFRRRAGRRERRRRWLRAAAVIAVSIGIGTTAGLASAQVRDGARRDSILKAAQADLAILALRLDLARAGLEDASRKFRTGAAGSEAVATAGAELRAMEAKGARMKLNIEEINATSQTPRDELTAPLVGPRDFVKDRIQLELAGAQQRLTAAEQQLAEVASRIRIGVVSELAGSEAKLEMARARAALAVLGQRLMLRREFVEKGTDAQQVAQRLELSEVQLEIDVTQQSQRLAQARLETIQRQLAAGVATKLDMMRAELDAQERELELRQLALRLRQLRDTRPE